MESSGIKTDSLAVGFLIFIFLFKIQDETFCALIRSKRVDSRSFSGVVFIKEKVSAEGIKPNLNNKTVPEGLGCKYDG